jgi:hypothetical protein
LLKTLAWRHARARRAGSSHVGREHDCGGLEWIGSCALGAGPEIVHFRMAALKHLQPIDSGEEPGEQWPAAFLEAESQRHRLETAVE